MLQSQQNHVYIIKGHPYNEFKLLRNIPQLIELNMDNIYMLSQLHSYKTYLRSCLGFNGRQHQKNRNFVNFTIPQDIEISLIQDAK